MFCMDITKLYPRLPYEEGIEACDVALNSRSNQRIPTSAVLDMIKLVLTNNVFENDGKQYRQTEGTAIGSK